MSKKKTAKITLSDIKDEGWSELGHDLGMSDKEISETFQYGEYGGITIEVDEDLNIVGGYVHK